MKFFTIVRFFLGFTLCCSVFLSGMEAGKEADGEQVSNKNRKRKDLEKSEIKDESAADKSTGLLPETPGAAIRKILKASKRARTGDSALESGGAGDGKEEKVLHHAASKDGNEYEPGRPAEEIKAPTIPSAINRIGIGMKVYPTHLANLRICERPAQDFGRGDFVVVRQNGDFVYAMVALRPREGGVKDVLPDIQILDNRGRIITRSWEACPAVYGEDGKIETHEQLGFPEVYEVGVIGIRPHPGEPAENPGAAYLCKNISELSAGTCVIVKSFRDGHCSYALVTEQEGLGLMIDHGTWRVSLNYYDEIYYVPAEAVFTDLVSVVACTKPVVLPAGTLPEPA